MAKRKRKSSAIAIDIPGDDDWRARDDLSTLTRAHEVLGDTGRLAAMKKEAKRQTESLARISRLEGVNLSAPGRTLREQPKMAEKGSATNRHPKREGGVERPGRKVDQSDVGKK